MIHIFKYFSESNLNIRSFGKRSMSGLMRQLAIHRTINAFFCSRRLQMHGFLTVQAGDLNLMVATLFRAVLCFVFSAWMYVKFFSAQLAVFCNLWFPIGVVFSCLCFTVSDSGALLGAILLFIFVSFSDVEPFAACNANEFNSRSFFVNLLFPVSLVSAIQGAKFSGSVRSSRRQICFFCNKHILLRRFFCLRNHDSKRDTCYLY